MIKRALSCAVLAAAAVAVVAVSVATGDADRVDAQCRAVFGSLNDGVCLDGPQPSGPVGGVPWINVGPTGAGPGITTSPLLPGQTINVPFTP